MTWWQTATHNIMINKETPNESRCLPLTSIDLLGGTDFTTPADLDELLEAWCCRANQAFQSAEAETNPHRKESLQSYADGILQSAVDLVLFLQIKRQEISLPLNMKEFSNAAKTVFDKLRGGGFQGS